MLQNYDQLFKPYTKDGHTLENTLKYLKAEALKHNISQDAMEIAVDETFAEIAAGKSFSMTKCSCGCGLDKAATDLIHSIRDRMFELNNEILEKTKQILQDRFNNTIIAHMQRDNQDYLNSQMKYNPWKETLLSKYYKTLRYYRDNSPVVKKVSSWL